MAARHHLPYIASAALVAALAAPCAFSAPAYASTLDDLQANYQAAVGDYQSTVVEQIKNSAKSIALQNEIEIANSDIIESQQRLSEATVKLYKSERHRTDMLDFVLRSSSLTDAMDRYESYARVQSSCRDALEGVRQEQADLHDDEQELQDERGRIEAGMADAVQAIEEAEAAIREADHSDGAKYHQVQGNGSNCGATAFIVGVNILLHENRYPDNVAVWNGPGFQGDSTTNLGFKAKTWLMANGLSDQIQVTTVPGDIHTTAQLKEELNNAHVVVISSGPGSVWQRANGTSTGPGTFPDGHWIVFYHEKDGVYYANDSSVNAKLGAGCAFTEKQMQQWLDGRGNHFAVSLAKSGDASSADSPSADTQTKWFVIP